MNRPSRENVLSMRSKPLSVVTVPSPHSKGAEDRGAVVVTMPIRSARLERRRGMVVEMPSRSARAKERSRDVVQMPARNSEAAEILDPQSSLRANSQVLCDGIRMTLVALFALLGWPRPTHGKDPGAAGARPWKLELLNVISKLQIQASVPARGMAAQGSVLAFQRPASEEIGADLASAA